MEIHFRTGKLEKLCNSEKEMKKKFGTRMVKLLQQRLAELSAAETLEDMRHLAGARCHELRQDREGQLAVDLEHPKRLIFAPDHDPVPAKPDGGLDWFQVTAILVIEITDYH